MNLKKNVLAVCLCVVGIFVFVSGALAEEGEDSSNFSYPSSSESSDSTQVIPVDDDFMSVVDIALAKGVDFSKQFPADFNNDGVLDKLVCNNKDYSVKVFDGKKLSNVLYDWASTAANTVVTDKKYPDVISKRVYTSCTAVELVPGRPSIVISSAYAHPKEGLRVAATQFVFLNLGIDSAGKLKMSWQRVTTGDNVMYTVAARSVKCTPYPKKLVAAGNANGALCFFAGYDQPLSKGYGTKTALLKLENRNGKLVAKDLTKSAGLLWSGGVNGTSKGAFRTYRSASGSTKFDGLHMMEGAWVDFNKDGLLDLITVGQHASVRASKMVINNSKPEGISFTTNNIVTSSNKTMTEFLTVQALNEQDKRITNPCVYLSGEVANLNALKSFDVPDHIRCFENGTWALHMLPGGKAYSSVMSGAAIKVDASGRRLIMAPNFTTNSSGNLVPATPARNLFEINSNDTCQVRVDSQLLNADKTAVLKSESRRITVVKGTVPRIGGWIECNSTTRDAYFTGQVLISGTSNITELGWWTEKNFLARKSAFEAIRWRKVAPFSATVGVKKSVELWNGCAKQNSKITATVLSCTNTKQIVSEAMGKNVNSQLGTVLGASTPTPEFIANLLLQLQTLVDQMAALLK